MARGKRAKRMPASSRLISGEKRGTLHGRQREGLTKSARQASPALLGRLRRLEVLLLHLCGRLKLDSGQVEKMLDNVQDLWSDTQDLDGD